MIELDDHYKIETNLDQVGAVTRGGFYVTKIEGDWYRVRVLDTTENGVQCFFIDYGDEDVVPQEALFLLDRKFARLEAQVKDKHFIGFRTKYLLV